MINTRVQQRNPFPGIRPFSPAEDKFFFGRETVISELLEMLHLRRFVAMAGPSGGGKTSLIQSGIIPELITDDKENWVPVYIRPGIRPVESLVRGLKKVFPNKITDSDVQVFLQDTRNLSDLILDKELGNYKYFIVVDQFEELFRPDPTVKKKRKNGTNPDSRRFSELLASTVKDQNPEVYVMISIRLDYLDDCSLLRPLSELIGRNRYLLPEMTRESLSRSILGPIHQAGARAEAGFEEFLLDDAGEASHPLPMLQHALMRTWDQWAQRGDSERPISRDDYQAVGSVNSSLGHHLEEVFAGLDSGQQNVAERLFKTITLKTDQHSGAARQASILTIARIAQCQVEEVIDVVEHFRRPDRGYILPGVSVPLRPETVIELAHESMIDIWDRLRDWVEEEAQSVQMYLKLSDASALYQQGRTELWKPPELQMALKWRESQKPTPAWGVQYNPAFERAMVFLSTSEEEYQWQEERSLILQRRRLIFNRAIAVFMGVVLVAVALIFFLTRDPTGGAADHQDAAQDLAYSSDPVDNEPVRPSVRESGETLSDPSETPVNETPAGEPDLTVEESPAVSPADGNTENRAAGRLSGTSRVSRQDDSRVREPEETFRSSDERGRAEEESPTPEPEATAGVSRRQALDAARLAAQSSTELNRNPELQGLLAYQAYQLYVQNDGNTLEREIYQGLYEAQKKLISPAYNIYPNIRNTVKSLAWLERTGSFLAAMSDGSIKILSGNIADRASQLDLAGTGLPNEALVVSPDERLAAIGTNGGGLLFIELENRGEVVHRSTEEGNILLFLEGLGKTGRFISAGVENRVVMWDFNSRARSLLITTSSRPSALAGSPNGRSAAVGARDGSLIEFNVNDPTVRNEIQNFGNNHVRSLAYGPRGNLLIAGLLDGSLKVMSGSGRRMIATLRGPGSRVTDLAVSPDGRFLAAVSHDGNVYLWSTADWESPPIVFQENNGFVLSVCFSGNSNYFYTGSVDYPRLVGRPSEASEMARGFCSLVTRNLTRAEWEEYFGEDIPYERTCPGLN